MKIRRFLEFIVVLLAIAVFTLVTRGSQHPKAKALTPKATELSVGGVKLGMTRQQVHEKLGPPLRTEEEIGILGFEKENYGNKEGWGEPEVTYNTNGLVVRVFGQMPLNWPEGTLDAKASESDILELFPTAKVQMTPSGHPWLPGKILVPEQSLFFLTQRSGIFSKNRFLGADLALPYSYEFEHYWTERSGGGSLLSTTAKRRRYLTPAKALAAEALACYFCVQKLSSVTFPYKTAAVCPKCQNDTVLAGSSTELTPEYLQEVHNAWFEPETVQAFK